MTSVPEFNCIFCKETFDDKESLQIHFRKHGDPKFNPKKLLIPQNDSKMSNEKSNDQVEMVSCDVCPEVFTTISKAITHKHKVHPDHDAKYFCSWCGKLFTMKHLYNKHNQANHRAMEKSEEKSFHCDMCNVDFFVPMAMLYHNKFFHRQDTDLPCIGLSKKLKLYNQEAVQIYYCAFCGEEYENKVNLHKHISDDHSDENQSPDEVLRCPLCEAIFYHFDAYEIHLTFHSSEDLYNDKNEMRDEITEFSLETVAPIAEKVENIEPKDPEVSMNAMGIDQFLQLAMDESDESTFKKSKKKKKHKKSKTHAITLDQFLNMNKDVFGDEIDFQGAEEVPTQVVAKQLKANNKQPAKVKNASKFITQTNIEKLKQQGIVVKKKPGINSSKFLNIDVGKQLTGISLKNPQNIITPAKCSKESNILSTSNEMLSKLINQSNNQIKIVKKTSQDKNFVESQQENLSMLPENKDPNFEQTEMMSSDAIKMKNYETNNSELQSGEIEMNHATSCHDFETASPDANKNALAESFTDYKDKVHLDNDDNIILEHVTTKETIDPISSSTQDAENSSTVRNVNNIEAKSAMLLKNTDGSEQTFDKNNSGKINHDTDIGNIEHKQKITDQNTDSLSALKHLSHLITVKSLSKKSYDLKDGNLRDNIESNNIQPINTEHVSSNENEVSHLSRNSLNNTLTKAMDALKNIKSNITIKPLTLSTQPCSKDVQKDCSEDDDYDDDFYDDNEHDLNKDELMTRNKNIGIKVKTEPDDQKPSVNAKIPLKQMVCNTAMQSSKPNKTLLSISDKEHNKNEENSVNDQTNTNFPTNVTLPKQLNITKNVTKQAIEKSYQSTNIINKNFTHKYIKSKEIHEDIEIFNIEDSDSDDNNESNENEKNVDNSTNSYKPEISTVQPMDALKHLGKNITVKNMKQQLTTCNQHLDAKLPPESYSTQSDDSNDGDHTSSKEMKAEVDFQTPQHHKNLAIKHVLANLGKNITVKSKNSSPSQSVTSQDHNTQDSTNEKPNDSDSDSGSNNVKITSLENNDRNVSENEMDLEQHNETDQNTPSENVMVQSPNDSCSDNEDMKSMENHTDVEDQIKINKLAKSQQNITISKNAQCLSSLRNINKNITIKSVNNNTKLAIKAEDDAEVSNNHLTVTPHKQAKMELQNNTCNPGNKNHNFMTRNLKTSSKNQSNASNQVNTINKEVTVKTFQTQTVIEEITTTVTKTIRTVNQSVNQEMQSQSSSSSIVKPRIIQGIRPSFQSSSSLQSTGLRHITPPIGSRIRNAAPTLRAGAVVRPSKQIVPVRPGINLRPNIQRMPGTPRPSTSGQQKPVVVGNTLKISPQAVTTSVNKRPRNEAAGHFSCFKKPKESLIPVSDVSSLSNNDANCSTHFETASHLSKSNVTTTKTVKGHSVITSTQMKSEVSASSQQLSKLSSLSGLKIIKTSQLKQTESQEKYERSSPKQTTLDAIQKLQKQGLLVKKPRLDIDEDSEHSEPPDDSNVCSTDENDD